MRSERERPQGQFSLGARRYLSPAAKAAKSSGFFDSARQNTQNRFAQAIKELSAEDEELPLPDDQGPIVYKDGIFQIDVSNTGSPPSIDPALKGLIDSILGS